MVGVRHHHGAPKSGHVSSLGNKVDSSDWVGPGNPRSGLSPGLARSHLKPAPSRLGPPKSECDVWHHLQPGHPELGQKSPTALHPAPTPCLSLPIQVGISAPPLNPAGPGRQRVEPRCLRWCQPSQRVGVALPACRGARACQGAGALCRVEGVRGGIVGAQMLNFMYF